MIRIESRRDGTNFWERHMKAFATRAMLLILAINLAACDNSNKPTVVAPQEVKAVRHYQLKGTVISIDTKSKMVNVDGEDVPGFMEAMKMPYKVKPEEQLEKLHPGDIITAEIVLQMSNGSGWLENVVVTGHSSPAPTK